MDKVSSMGFAFGYISGVIPFAISLALISFIGIEKAIGYQIGFILTALWWGLLTLPMIKDVKQKYYVEPGESCTLYIPQRLGFPNHLLAREEKEAYNPCK